MTLPLEKIGYKGQRYEVRARDVESGVGKPIGWSNDIEGARKMKDAVELWPRYEEPYVLDLQTGERVE